MVMERSRSRYISGWQQNDNRPGIYPLMNNVPPSPPNRELSFEYDRIYFGGRDITNESDILLDIMGHFSIKVGSRVLYEEEGFSLVELAIELNDWLLADFRNERDFAADLTEYDEVGLVQLWAQGNHQWRVGSSRQQYEETTYFDADVIESISHTYIESVVKDLRETFGIQNFPMTSRYVGRALYIHNPCTRCGSGVGFWICGDGETMVLRCERCDKVWLEPYSVTSPNVKQTYKVESASLTTIPTFRRGVSRWATLEEIRAKGWDEWIELYIRFSNATPKATIRINIANIELPSPTNN